MPDKKNDVLRIPNRISKFFFASGADDFLAMLEGKIRESPFFLSLNHLLMVSFSEKATEKKVGILN